MANQPNVNAGILDVDSSEKVARFVRLCDAFNLPVVTLVDTPGYKPGAEQEHAGIIRRGAKVIYAYANAQVPLVTIILRKAFGGAYIVMGSKAIGADMNFAWPSSQIAVLGAAGAVNIIHRKDLQKAKDNGKDVEALRAKYIADYERTTVNANLSLEMGEIDAMIDPRTDTRDHHRIAPPARQQETRAPNQQTPRQPAAVTDATRRNQRKQPQQSQRNFGTSKEDYEHLFLDRLNSEPHALAFAGQSTPWPVALADQSANPALDEALHTHAAAAQALLYPVSAELLATTGRPVDLFGLTEPGTSGRRSRGFRQRSRHRADPAGGALLDAAALGYNPAQAKPVAVLGHSQGVLAVHMVQAICEAGSIDAAAAKIDEILAIATLIGVAGTRQARQLGLAARHGEATPMLSVKDITRAQVDALIELRRRRTWPGSPWPSPIPPRITCCPAIRRTWPHSAWRSPRNTSVRPSCAKRRCVAAACSTRRSNIST